MNQTMMESPCSCLSLFSPSRGLLVDTTGPEPSIHGAGAVSTPGPVPGLEPDRLTSPMSKRRRTSTYQLGPFSLLRSTSSTSAGPQLDTAVEKLRKHDYGENPRFEHVLSKFDTSYVSVIILCLPFCLSIQLWLVSLVPLWKKIDNADRH